MATGAVCLFKQATIGPAAESARPFAWNLVGRAKFDAWSEHVSDARAAYCAVLDRVFPGWDAGLATTAAKKRHEVGVALFEDDGAHEARSCLAPTMVHLDRSKLDDGPFRCLGWREQAQLRALLGHVLAHSLVRLSRRALQQSRLSSSAMRASLCAALPRLALPSVVAALATVGLAL